jgi:hypothetical protein
MTGYTPNITPNESPEAEAALIAALAGGATVTQAAASLGCAVSTVYWKLNDPAFRAALATAKGNLWQPETERARAHVNRAIDVIFDLMQNVAHPSTRLRAAVEMVRVALDLKNVADTQPRLVAIEAALAMNPEPRGGTDEPVGAT